MPAPLDDESGNHFRREPRPGRRVAVRWRWALPATSAEGQDRDRDAPEDGGAGAGWTSNIGTGGAFIETSLTRPRGAALSLEIDLPCRQGAVIVSAEVRWVAPASEEGPAGMGVHFVALPEATRVSLHEYFGTLTDTVDHDEAL